MFRKLSAALAALCFCASASAQQASAQPGAVDPAVFADPAAARSGHISPNGAYVAYIGRDATTEFVVVVDLATHRGVQMQTLQSATGRYDWVGWKGDNKLIFAAHVHQNYRSGPVTGSIAAGRTSFQYDIARVFAMNRDGTGMVQMFQGQSGLIDYGYGSTDLLNDLRTDPTHVLIEAPDNSGYTGVWKADIGTGTVERVENGNEYTWNFWTDIQGNVVMRVDAVWSESAGVLEGWKFFRRAPGAHDWTLATEVRGAATATNTPDFEPLSAGPQPGKLYLFGRPNGQDASSLYLYDTATGDMGAPLMQGAGGADVGTIIIHPATRQLAGVCDGAARETCRALDPVVQRNLLAINGFFHGAAALSWDTSDDGSKWLVYAEGPTLAGGYYTYDLAAHDLEPLVDSYPHVDHDVLAPTEVVNYDARDGTHLWMYVTARPGVAGPRPMVVMPHGGPESRDEYGYDSFVELLAARGYVVIQPNFRGGSGFGRAFANAGRGQWGLRMQDDVTDAVRREIAAGVADPHKICIVGASYGGYAALAGVALTPDLYKCAVSISGISDLTALLRTSGPTDHRSITFQYWRLSIGDPIANHAALVAASPALQAAHVAAPVLLIHGNDDYNVPVVQSQLMQRALQAAGHPTRLLTVENEGHQWDRWKTVNVQMLYRETDAFLAQNLGPATH